MLRIYSTILSACLVLWLPLSTALAGANDCELPAFGIKNVEVDSLGATGQDARQNGVELATADALRLVLERVAQASDGDTITVPSDGAADFVDFIHIQTENALANRYIATLDICFDAERLRKYMKAKRYNWAEIASPDILILPIWQDPSGVRLWQRNNVWIESWNALADSHEGLINFTALEANLNHERQVRAPAIFEQQPSAIQTAARLGKARQILWVYAALNYGASERTVSLKASLFDDQGRKVSDVLERAIALNATTNMVLQFDVFRADVAQKVESGWKQANIVTTKVLDSNYIVSIDLRSLKDWRRFQSVLREMQSVRSAQTVKLGVDKGTVRVSLAGSASAFEQAIQSAGYRLQIEDGQYLVSHIR